MLILLSGGRNRRDYELEMAQLRSGERSHITSGTLLKNIQRTKAAFQEVFDSDGYVTPTEIHCPLCGQVRKSPDNTALIIWFNRVDDEVFPHFF